MLGKEFGLNYGQSKTLNSYVLTIKFKDVIEDSRCPEGALCVWEGNAKVAIEISQNEYFLNTTLEPKEIIYGEFKVKLVSVSPHPKINEQIATKDYKINLIVEK